MLMRGSFHYSTVLLAIMLPYLTETTISSMFSPTPENEENIFSGVTIRPYSPRRQLRPKSDSAIEGALQSQKGSYVGSDNPHDGRLIVNLKGDPDPKVVKGPKVSKNVDAGQVARIEEPTYAATPVHAPINEVAPPVHAPINGAATLVYAPINEVPTPVQATNKEAASVRAPIIGAVTSVQAPINGVPTLVYAPINEVPTPVQATNKEAATSVRAPIIGAATSVQAPINGAATPNQGPRSETAQVSIPAAQVPTTAFPGPSNESPKSRSNSQKLPPIITESRTPTASNNNLSQRPTRPGTPQSARSTASRQSSPKLPLSPTTSGYDPHKSTTHSATAHIIQQPQDSAISHIKEKFPQIKTTSSPSPKRLFNGITSWFSGSK